MQDSDPKHTAHNTKMWILHNTPKYLKKLPQLADINQKIYGTTLNEKFAVITFHPRKILKPLCWKNGITSRIVSRLIW
jgi:hypothetical protein